MSENTPAAGQPTESPQGWGAPPPPAPPGPRWTWRRTLVAAGVAVGIAAAGGVAVYAASGSADAGANAGGQGLHIMPPGGGDGGGPLMMFEIPHGEFQTGEVTELTDTSITAKSDDGFSRTYVIDDDTTQTDGIEKGDTVTIIATTEGDTATAASISELSTRGGGPPNAPDAPQGPDN